MYHLFHLVKMSHWPLLSGFAAFTLCNGGVLYMHQNIYGKYILILGFCLLIFTMVMWWVDIIDEAFEDGFHTLIVQQGLKYGMILFIVSEIMFFFAFFWAYFHSSLAPAVELGAIWPPEAIQAFSPWEIPLLNTFILLLSGVTVTWAHHSIINKLINNTIYSLFLTIILAILFTILQAYEYREAAFDISDSVYGSTFFMATGFHGLHVILGTIFLIVALIRYLFAQFSNYHHFGFEAAAWYWHFVDVVWLFLYIWVYAWGN